MMGKQVCFEGKIVCNAPSPLPSAEKCDGMDNDCDGQIDESDACPLTVTSIAVGFSSTCAVLSDGTARCWGDNGAGQLGDGTTVQRNRPTLVQGLTNAAQVAVGVDHACALLRDGTIRCWGANDAGKLGNNTSGSFAPVSVQGINRVMRIAASASSTCAILDDSTVSCWGSVGSTETSAPTPFPGLSGVAELSLSLLYDAGCARLTSGQVTCWDHGQPPSLVPDISGAVSVGVGYSHACAARSDGTVRCWNQGGSAQALKITGADQVNAAASVGAGMYFSCARLRDGRVRCGGDTDHALGTGMGGSSSTIIGLDVAALAVGLVHNCAITKAGAISCWGDNSKGQIGDGAPDNKYMPVTVIGIP